MSKTNLRYYKCPNCMSTGTFEEVYCGGHPHVYQYACTECGITSPVASDVDDKVASDMAYIELERFLSDMYEPVRLLSELYMSTKGVEFKVGSDSHWIDFVQCCEEVKNYLEDKYE